MLLRISVRASFLVHHLDGPVGRIRDDEPSLQRVHSTLLLTSVRLRDDFAIGGKLGRLSWWLWIGQGTGSGFYVEPFTVYLKSASLPYS